MPAAEPDYKKLYIQLLYHLTEIDSIVKKALRECDEAALGAPKMPPLVLNDRDKR